MPYFYSPSSTLIRQQKQQQMLKSSETSPIEKTLISSSSVKARSKSSTTNASHHLPHQFSIASQDFSHSFANDADAAAFRSSSADKNNVFVLDNPQLFSNQQAEKFANNNQPPLLQQQHQYRVKTQQPRGATNQMLSQKRSQTVAPTSSLNQHQQQQQHDDLSTANDFDEFSSRNNSYSRKSEVIESRSPSNVVSTIKQSSANTPQQTRNMSIKKLRNFFGEKVKKILFIL